VHEPLARHVDDRGALVVTARDEVEGDVDRACLRRNGIGVLVDGALVERIDDSDLRAAACGGDVGCDAHERRAGAAGEELIGCVGLPDVEILLGVPYIPHQPSAPRVPASAPPDE